MTHKVTPRGGSLLASVPHAGFLNIGLLKWQVKLCGIQALFSPVIPNLGHTQKSPREHLETTNVLAPFSTRYSDISSLGEA